MTAEEALVTRLNATPGVTALVGARIYPMLIPQGAVMPAVTYQRISTVRPGSLRGPVGIADPRIQVNCWADTYSVAKAVAQQVRQSLDGYDSDGVAAVILGEHDLINPDGLRKCVTQDYSIWHPEEV